MKGTKFVLVVVFIVGMMISAVGVCGHGEDESCFHPDTQVMVKDAKTNEVKWVSAKEIFDNSAQYKLISFETKGSSNKVARQESAIGETEVNDIGNMPMFKIEIAGGKQILLTGVHPVQTYDGRVVQARALTKDDNLLSIDGRKVVIKAITTVPFKGKIYNFTVTSASHLIGAGGIIVGDLKLQTKLSQSN